MNNQDLKSIINTACKYNDIEVLEKIASSKIIKTAAVRDLLEGLGLQMSQTSNLSQFKDKTSLTNFLRSSRTVDDREASSEILEWWTKKIKEIGTSPVNISIEVFNNNQTTEREISFTPRGCVEKSDLEQVWNALPATDLHKMYGFDPSRLSVRPSASLIYEDKENPPTVFNITKTDSNGNEIWPSSGSPAPVLRPAPGTSAGVNLGTTFINIEKGGGNNMGYLDFLRLHLNRVNPPKMSENIHVKIFDMLNASMTDKAMSSMIRKNALAETPRAGLISNWKYIVSLPKEIENRMAKTPKTLIDYKQKLALKKYGRDLSQILNQRIQYTEFVYNNPVPALPHSHLNQGLDREIPFYKINELSNSYFMEPNVMAQVTPLMARTGELLNKIIPELDKDSSLTRNILQKVVTPSDYLNSRGKEFH